jgi:hypothetical protein
VEYATVELPRLIENPPQPIIIADTERWIFQEAKDLTDRDGDQGRRGQANQNGESHHLPECQVQTLKARNHAILSALAMPCVIWPRIQLSIGPQCLGFGCKCLKAGKSSAGTAKKKGRRAMPGVRLITMRMS